jgi:glyoxylase I family protein
MVSSTFAHVAIGCKDPIATERFYTKYFGFKRARIILIDTEQIVFIKSGTVHLELFLAKEESPFPKPEKDGPQYPGLRHLAFRVDNVDAMLKEMGGDAKITLGPLNFDDFIQGWRTVWVADPEGNIVEISQGYVDEGNLPPLI